ncbi:hypothetical protein ANN_05690 [Periplaneta americana]|uniref:Arf-GAP domain-containing protein n=1 Tax=Periplaneta americana TaxID=6978 RepID=A0ABQ8TCE0_PERAM|nr:hypothetical protein ANN_05690 [Periplaneta americana]
MLRKIFGAKRDEVTGEWRKLHNTELHALYSSPDIIRNFKSRRFRWLGHVARMGESRNAYRVLVGRLEGKRPLGRPRHRWEDNIKMGLREVGYDDRDWINLAQVRDRWLAYVRAAMKLRLVCYTGPREHPSPLTSNNQLTWMYSIYPGIVFQMLKLSGENALHVHQKLHHNFQGKSPNESGESVSSMTYCTPFDDKPATCYPLRGLTPPHRVKSISMASFSPEEVELIKSRGNEYCRRIWLGLYDTNHTHDTKDEQQIKDFMVAKYEKKRYYLEPSAAAKNNGSVGFSPPGTQPQSRTGTPIHVATPATTTTTTVTTIASDIKPLSILLGSQAKSLTLNVQHYLQIRTMSSQFTVLLSQSLEFTVSRTTDLQRQFTVLELGSLQLRSTALELRSLQLRSTALELRPSDADTVADAHSSRTPVHKTGFLTDWLTNQLKTAVVPSRP